jgi:hypothetical protein
MPWFLCCVWPDSSFWFLPTSEKADVYCIVRQTAGNAGYAPWQAAFCLALWVCIQEWRGNFGTIMWFGWLTVAALTLIFTLAGGVPHGAAHKGHEGHGRKHRKGRTPENAAEFAAPASAEDAANKVALPKSIRFRARTKREFAWGAFGLLPCFFLFSVWHSDPWPVLREDAIHGTAGPWGFTLAETEKAAPKIGGSGVAMKEFELRFADDAQPEIRAAWLRARKPRSLRAVGIAFEGNHLRTASIVIPPAFQAEEHLWLTVEGRNGEVHHAVLDVAQLSPALARFLVGEEPAQKEGKGWEVTLSCWQEAKVVCQGARFEDGSDWGMDGIAIEVFGGNSESLLSTRLNRKGQLRFLRPDGEFHVLMEKGPGQTLELNERDVAQETGIR